MSDMELLVRDKYDGDASKVTKEDTERLAAGEPPAYVIGWVPFLGLHIDLSSRPLIPRPETEWWTNELIEHLHERFGNSRFRLLDLCAGSGAIGLAILKEFPHAHISFGELMPEHIEQIRRNIELNGFDTSRAHAYQADLFDAFGTQTWDFIVSNPPYIPDTRRNELDATVTDFEPHGALFAGTDGMDIIRRIIAGAPAHMSPRGELWMECDISNIQSARALSEQVGAQRTVILTDPYGRERVLVSYFP